jgi:hypothetical protein
LYREQSACGYTSLIEDDLLHPVPLCIVSECPKEVDDVRGVIARASISRLPSAIAAHDEAFSKGFGGSHAESTKSKYWGSCSGSLTRVEAERKQMLWRITKERLKERN